MNELLQLAIEKGIINVDVLNDQLNMKRKQKIIEEKHEHKIWQGDNGKWYTYLPDKEKGRVLKKKSTKEELENLICEYYKDAENTFGTVFKEWINKKLELGEIKKQTYDRYYTDFDRFFKKTGFCNRPIMSINEMELEEWIKKVIHDQNLTNKAYSGLRTIIIGTMKYAKKKGITDISPKIFFGDLELSRKAFQPRIVKDEDSVFTKKETEEISKFLWEKPTIINLGILLVFQTGLRIGELSALQYSDVNGNLLSITKTEERYKAEDGSYIFQVRDSAKTDAGNRIVIMNDEAVKIITQIRKLNPFGEYMFMKNGERVKGRAFTFKLMKVCKQLCIAEKSMHKIRKTYATKLINGGVDEKIIIKQLGHTNISCTKDYYYYNDKDFDEASKQILHALSM